MVSRWLESRSRWQIRSRELLGLPAHGDGRAFPGPWRTWSLAPAMDAQIEDARGRNLQVINETGPHEHLSVAPVAPRLPAFVPTPFKTSFRGRKTANPGPEYAA